MMGLNANDPIKNDVRNGSTERIYGSTERI